MVDQLTFLERIKDLSQGDRILLVDAYDAYRRSGKVDPNLEPRLTLIFIRVMGL